MTIKAKIREEKWEVVPEYEEHYMVSNFGRVKSIKFGKERILKCKKHHSGYIAVDLLKPGYLTRTVRVHRLVADIFIENSEEHPVVNHIDGNKSNNDVNNLEWCDYSHNNKEAYRLGLNKTRKVIQLSLDGKIIRSWDSLKEAGETLGIQSTGISGCARGKVETCGGYKWKYSYRGFEEISKEGKRLAKDMASMFLNKGIKGVAISGYIEPKRATKGSAGSDLFYSGKTLEIPPGEKIVIITNVKAYMQQGEALIALNRSSQGTFKDVILANILGLVDQDYYNNKGNEGNIAVALKNTGVKTYVIENGDAIAQAVFIPFLEPDNLSEDVERESGFGHTSEK